ncbi:16249_t:CDS:1, partial [Acaulospora colombiana]
YKTPDSRHEKGCPAYPLIPLVVQVYLSMGSYYGERRNGNASIEDNQQLIQGQVVLEHVDLFTEVSEYPPGISTSRSQIPDADYTAPTACNKPLAIVDTGKPDERIDFHVIME